MAETLVDIVVRPMKGRSHGEWYPSADDIAASDEEAEYWAILGLTADGKIYLADDFETEDMAVAALAHYG